MNVGVITVIWALNPLYMAVADFFINGRRLKWYHLVGTFSMVACSVLLSLSTIVGVKPTPAVEDIVTDVKKKAFPGYVPVIFGILTPVFFTSQGILTKYMTGERKPGVVLSEMDEKRKFTADNLNLSTTLYTNILILCAAIPYWCLVDFNLYLFILGTVGAVINTLGLTSI